MSDFKISLGPKPVPSESQLEPSSVVDRHQRQISYAESDFHSIASESDFEDADDGDSTPSATKDPNSTPSGEGMVDVVLTPDKTDAATIRERSDTIKFPSGSPDLASTPEAPEDAPDTPQPLPTIVHHPTPPLLPLRANHVQAPSLPPRKSPAFAWFRKSTNLSASHSSTSSRTMNNSDMDHALTSDLLLNRLNQTTEGLMKNDELDQQRLKEGSEELKKSFDDLKTKLSTEVSDDEIDIDWKFWTYVVHDYSSVARNSPVELAAAISAGIPTQLRGTVWQLIASSKSSTLEDLYHNILSEHSPYEKQIRRDLSRTSFITNNKSNENKIEELFNIIKGYSLFDPEVGYTQGMAFIAVPLLLNMDEPEAFGLLVAMMKNYTLRSFFLPDMPGLHLRLYQFDRLLEDNLPQLYLHLSRQGVRSSMYASQWFLTLFAYKFPLQIVLRIMDIIIAEGTEALLKFGLALMEKNMSTLLGLEFEDLLNFLKDKLFNCYLVEKTEDGSNAGTPTFINFMKTTGGNVSSAGGTALYRVTELVSDASVVKLTPIILSKYEAEYKEIHRIEKERNDEIVNLRTSNGQLLKQVKKLESSLAMINREHIEVANEMVQGKVQIASLADENKELQEENRNLRVQVDTLIKEKGTLEKDHEKDTKEMKKEVQEEITQTMKRNAEVMETNRILEEKLAKLEAEMDLAKTELHEKTESHAQLLEKWTHLKHALAE